MSRIIKTDKFTVQASDGRQFEVMEYEEYIAAGAPDNPDAEIPGSTKWQTSDGLHLNVIADDTFEIAELWLSVNRVPTSVERLLGGRDKLKDYPRFCGLCGTPNKGASKRCISCGIPLDYYSTGEMPEGWEKCSIRWEGLYDADPTHKVWRFVGKVHAPRGIFSIHPSATFILEKGWEESDYVPTLPPEGELALQTQRRELLAEGWIPQVTGGLARRYQRLRNRPAPEEFSNMIYVGKPSDWEFWRKTVRVDPMSHTPTP